VLSASELFKISVCTLATVVGLINFSACGPRGSTRPVKKYDQLRKSSIPAQQVEVREQTYVGTDTYVIKPETNLEFITGRKTEVKIRVMLQIPGAKYSLVTSDLPEGASLVQDSVSPVFWILSWEPKTDVVPRGEREINGEIHLAIQVQSLPDIQSETLLKKMITQTTVSYRVSIAQDRPLITSVNNLPEEIIEGTNVNFNVSVQDLVSDLSNPPKLDIFYSGQESSSESLRFNGSMYVSQIGTPHRNEDGTWTFLMSFNTIVIGLPEFSNEGVRNRKPSLPVSFYLKATSANGTVSSDNKVDRDVHFNKMILVPEFSTELDGEITVFQGGKLNFSFSVILANGRGVLTAQFNDSEINSWPGAHSFSCEDKIGKGLQNDNTIKKYCRLVWELPCDASVKKYDFSLIAKAFALATDADSKKSQVLKRTILVQRAEVCQPPKVTNTAPKVKKPKAKSAKTK
jgi:hypothetical protein